jgi:glutaredoxin|tara:strand:- start:1405 stop:1641 length:237 start_codon:yes stop_codon:yes gene_type:complete
MNFTVYSKSGCGYCEKVISVLQLAELNYVEYKLDRDFDKKEFYSQFGEGSTFPQVSVDAYTIGGAADTVKYLQEYNLV